VVVHCDFNHYAVPDNMDGLNGFSVTGDMAVVLCALAAKPASGMTRLGSGSYPSLDSEC
jgi:hypothetical protein